MTSSLVGSEMCIRDRGVGAPAGGEALAPVDVETVLGGEDAFPFLGPVSYTHLTLPTICSV
eukprot:6039397-Prorocentrum_lima.AAC.1